MEEFSFTKLFNDIYGKLDDLTEFGSSPDNRIYLLTDQLQTSSVTTFPTAFIDFPYVYYKDGSAKVQLGNAMAKVLLAFDPEDLVDSPTSVFNLKDKVYAKLQGLRNTENIYTPLTRGGERTETKYTGIYVFEMDFYTTVQDTGVYAKKNFVDANNIGVNPNAPVNLDVTVEDNISLHADYTYNNPDQSLRFFKALKITTDIDPETVSVQLTFKTDLKRKVTTVDNIVGIVPPKFRPTADRTISVNMYDSEVAYGNTDLIIKTNGQIVQQPYTGSSYRNFIGNMNDSLNVYTYDI